MGIINLIVYEARDLSSGHIAANQLRPGVIVNTEMNGRTEIHATPWGFSGNPRWHSQCEALVPQGRRTRLILEVRDNNVDMGHINLPINDFLRGEEPNGRWWPLNGSLQGRLRLKVEWKALSTVHETVAFDEANAS
jgi:Ca2+-dependent lipid-binding protein